MSTHANEPGAQLPPTLTAEDAFLQGFGIGLKIRHNDNPAYDDWDMDAWAMLTVRTEDDLRRHLQRLPPERRQIPGQIQSSSSNSPDSANVSNANLDPTDNEQPKKRKQCREKFDPRFLFRTIEGAFNGNEELMLVVDPAYSAKANRSLNLHPDGKDTIFAYNTYDFLYLGRVEPGYWRFSMRFEGAGDNAMIVFRKKKLAFTTYGRWYRTCIPFYVDDRDNNRIKPGSKDHHLDYHDLDFSDHMGHRLAHAEPKEDEQESNSLTAPAQALLVSEVETDTDSTLTSLHTPPKSPEHPAT